MIENKMIPRVALNFRITKENKSEEIDILSRYCEIFHIVEDNDDDHAKNLFNDSNRYLHKNLEVSIDEFLINNNIKFYIDSDLDNILSMKHLKIIPILYRNEYCNEKDVLFCEDIRSLVETIRTTDLNFYF